MKLLSIHTCPLWSLPDGSRQIGIEPSAQAFPVVGWVNVLVVRLRGVEFRLLAVRPPEGERR